VKKEVEFERAFVKAGGLLLAGCETTGNGSALAGFGDQRSSCRWKAASRRW
jgi:hypothetical protein